MSKIFTCHKFASAFDTFYITADTAGARRVYCQLVFRFPRKIATLVPLEIGNLGSQKIECP